jgi:cob(I)alamin adenosyltransferase
MGCIHVYTGDGKGKSTAAIGLALRAAGAGKRVAFLYFDKGEDCNDEYYSERNLLRAIAEVDVYAFGMPRVKEDGSFRYGMNKEDIEEAQKGFQAFRQVIKLPHYFLIVADEIITAAYYSMIDYDDLYETLREYKHKPIAELVLTGRGASDKLIEMADLVTDMKKIKHYFDCNRKAVKGIEF